MSRPRVFYILGSLEANDMGDEIVTLLARMPRADFETRVISLGGRDDLRKRVADMKIRVYDLGLSGPLGVLRAVPRARGLLANMDASVVHGFGAWGGVVAQLAAPPEARVFRSADRPPAGGKDLRGWLLGLLEWWTARYGRPAHFVIPGEEVRDVVATSYAVDDITVLPPSIDVAAVRQASAEAGREAARTQLGIAPGETAVVCVTSYDSEATMDDILRGLAVARREAGQIRMFLVGSGRHEGSSRWKAEELHLDDAVLFLGRNGEEAAIWSAADVVVDATNAPGLSRSAMMARAAGLPVFKRAAVEVDDALASDSDPPTISAPADWFGADLVRLVEQPELRRRMAGEETETKLLADAGDVARELERLYLEAIGSA